MGAIEVPSDEVGTRRFENPRQLPPQVRSTRTYVSPGSCVTYDYDFSDVASASLVGELDAALAFQPRSEIVAAVDDETGLRLCGAGAPPCPGGDT